MIRLIRKRYLSRSQVDGRIMARVLMVQAKRGGPYATFAADTLKEMRDWPSPIGPRRYTVTINHLCYCFTNDESRARREFIKCVRAITRRAN